MIEEIPFSSARPAPAAKQLFPGYLLTPFGWAAQPLGQIVAAHPGLLPEVFALNRPRMRLIALALAHVGSGAVPKIGPVLVRGSAPEILSRVLGRSPPAGLQRVLRRLPVTVLSQENYRRLVQLLDDPATRNLVHHTRANLDDCTVEAIHGVPPALRPAALAVCQRIDGLYGLADGLRLVAARGAAPSFDALVADLAHQPQSAQFIARLRQLIADLPLPEALPPRQIGNGRRLDCGKEIRQLARNWQNCLGSYVEQVDHGRCAIYLWDDPTAPAACHVTRHGRLGWVLHDALGPNNREIDVGQLAMICDAFAAAGVAQARGVYAIEQILNESEWPPWVGREWRRRQSRQRLEAEAWEGGSDAA
jgi:hypothetical protein